MKHDEPIDMHAILTAGARLAGEKSRALPQRAYGDPAKHVQFERERKERQLLAEKRKRNRGEK